jgi:hypothetical protein
VRVRDFKSWCQKPGRAQDRPDRKRTLAVEAIESRVSMSGLGVSATVVPAFNPQPDPPTRWVRIIAI